MVWEIKHPGTEVNPSVSPANFFQWQDHTNVFEQMALIYDDHLNLTSDSEPEQISYQGVSWNLLSMLGTEPLLGRTFVASDAVPGNENVAVLSYGFWQRRFGAEPKRRRQEYLH